MSSSRALIFFTLSIFIHHLITPNDAEQGCTSEAEYCWVCSDVGNYSATSIYGENLNKLLTSISSSPSNGQNFNGFYNTSLGQNPNKVNAIALCRGDLTAEKCQSCLNDSNYGLLERCPNRKEAILWYEKCMLRYSSRDSIFSAEEKEPSKEVPSPQPTSNAQQFKQTLKPLLDDLTNKASSGDSLKKYAHGNVTVPDAESIFALLQCTPDLSQKECSDCLQNATSMIPGCCEGKQGARILKPSCNLRYESGPFYDSNDAPQSAGTCTDEAEYCWSCSDVSNDTSIGTYEESLKSLLFSFSSSNNTQNQAGFYNSSLGETPDRVYAIALCRGDLSQEDCRNCVNTSSERLIFRRCPGRREAVLWHERCMVRFSNKSIFSVKIDDPRLNVKSKYKVWNRDLFSLTLKPLLNNLTSTAASGDSLSKYASGESTVPGYEKIYATAQCTPDLDKQQCSDCLENANLFIPQCCDGLNGARLLKPSCNLRYEVTQFYAATDDDHSSVLLTKEGKSNQTTITVVAAVVPTVIVAVLVGVCIFLKLRKPGQEKLRTNSEDIIMAESLLYDFDTIAAATDDFSEENKLGVGGFGAVYKGQLSDGEYIAVKRLSKTSSQGDQEFKNEVVLVAKLQHRNLVRLLGFCLKEKERLLVYEYVPNSSLDRFIFDPTKRPSFDWDTRYKSIQGISRGLIYLHEDSRLRIIHRDLKASNILLDEEMNPKISDFGMARLFVFDQTQDNTSQIVGTYGYMAPEYAMHGQFSIKSDVFSFGVLLLEIVSGQKNSSLNRNGEDVEDLLTYAWANWKDGTASNIVDTALSGGTTSEIMRCIHIGLLCVQENITDRPTMNSVALMFISRSLTLAVPSKPAFYMRSTEGPNMSLASNVSGSNNSSSGPVEGSRNEASISELYPR
ncbi:Cysteine-rich receptor-like protein kinase 29 [Morus notabilis]|uniref:Cysteine-rich receptor-like protein kinase 29 n=1 Tax=Morus notabilis TaxID=981085 RepID=W9QWM8_9ROSA|nr:cysteine-rich receptor-like protein kinase 26 [Morus notabilis]EXB40709.1 Cysteine-rich receptor-like protein kinase 29 [Morus notabilis]